MPTGYTAGIINGTTETFQDFAKQCIRAFGATIHMRDEPMDKKYEPRVPSSYHTKELKRAKEELKQAQTLSDDEIVEYKRMEIEKNKTYYLNQIKEAQATKEKLTPFLEATKAFDPPTKEHEGFVKFMVEQIETTLGYDADTKYYEEELIQIDSELLNINAEKIREEMVVDAKRRIKYHSKEHKEELKRCKEHNQWVKDLLDALEQQL